MTGDNSDNRHLNAQFWFNIVQLVTSVAVVAGLALVVLELQQNRQIAKFQEATDGFTDYAESVRIFVGENGAKAWAEACDNPDTLSTESMVVMNHLLTNVLNRIRAAYIRQQIADDLQSFPWEASLGNFGLIASTDFGRWWWTTQQGWEPEIVQAGNEYLRQHVVKSCYEYYDLYRNRLKQ